MNYINDINYYLYYFLMQKNDTGIADSVIRDNYLKELPFTTPDGLRIFDGLKKYMDLTTFGTQQELEEVGMIKYKTWYEGVEEWKPFWLDDGFTGLKEVRIHDIWEDIKYGLFENFTRLKGNTIRQIVVRKFAVRRNEHGFYEIPISFFLLDCQNRSFCRYIYERIYWFSDLVDFCQFVVKLRWYFYNMSRHSKGIYKRALQKFPGDELPYFERYYADMMLLFMFERDRRLKDSVYEEFRKFLELSSLINYAY